jgi:hypothetical protein
LPNLAGHLIGELSQPCKPAAWDCFYLLHDGFDSVANGQTRAFTSVTKNEKASDPRLAACFSSVH